MRTMALMSCLLSALAFCPCAWAGTRASPELPIVLGYNPKVKLQHVLPAFDGMLLGFDGGEWGGGLVFLDQGGGITRMDDNNVQGILQLEQRVFVFTGLSHMGINRGAILEISLDATRRPAMQQLVDLQAAPSSITRLDDDSAVFEVFTGRFQDDRQVYQCKPLAHGVVSDSDACKANPVH